MHRFLLPMTLLLLLLSEMLLLMVLLLLQLHLACDMWLLYVWVLYLLLVLMLLVMLMHVLLLVLLLLVLLLLVVLLLVVMLVMSSQSCGASGWSVVVLLGLLLVRVECWSSWPGRWCCQVSCWSWPHAAPQSRCIPM